MSKKVVTVNVNDSMQDAMTLLKKHEIRMLPVLERGKLMGIVTDRDLRSASATDIVTFEIHDLLHMLSETKVKEIITKDPITIPFDYIVEEAGVVLLINKISGVPVVDHKGQIVATITQADLFSVLMTVTGMGKSLPCSI